jgi:hypothetical protein
MIRVTGAEETARAIRAEMNAHRRSAMAGLLEGGLLVQRNAQENVPHELGNLKGSAYTRKAMDGQLAVEVGFGADYALYVHENVGQKLKGRPRPSGLGVYWGPKGKPKYLEGSLFDMASRVVAAVAKHMRRGR